MEKIFPNLKKLNFIGVFFFIFNTYVFITLLVTPHLSWLKRPKIELLNYTRFVFSGLHGSQDCFVKPFLAGE